LGEKETVGVGLTLSEAAQAGPHARAQFAAMSPSERAMAGICRACGGCIVDNYGDCKGCGADCTKKDCICQNPLD